MKRTALTRATRALGLSVALIVGCTDETPGTASEKGAPVVLADVVQREFAPSIEGLGTARALESVLVTASASGRIEEIYFKEGARVGAHQALVHLEDDEERAEFAAAQAEAELAEDRYRRLRELTAKGLMPKDQLAQQEQVQKSAQARLQLARVRLEQRTVRAPFAGILGFRQLSQGALVQPGSPIVSLDAVDTLRVEFSVAETQLGELATGASVDVRAAAWPDRVFNGTIRAIGSRVDEVTRAVPVQALLDNRNGTLKPGMLLMVTAASRPRAALFVPESAVTPDQSRQFVWRVDPDGTAQKVDVTLGARLPGWVEVVDGLAAGERVVVEGQARLQPGVLVREVSHASATPG
ncbi:MAG: efflux RND transporter periplasmic adaptor subunit [Nevskiales bacterium]|nr:efflux RND transporter periplasmic adaptor subunit [Nevskiales bacterium]